LKLRTEHLQNAFTVRLSDEDIEFMKIVFEKTGVVPTEFIRRLIKKSKEQFNFE